MSLTGTTNEQKIWNYLLPIINNPMGVAAVIGAGTYPESGNIPNNLQNTYENNPEKTFGKSFNDQTYTAAVDNGTYTRENFSQDKAGYGLCQWTYWSRKQALYDHCKSKKVSIGNLEAQLEYLVKELKQYGLLTKLQAVTDLRMASNIILLAFEKPASKDTKETQDRRFGYTQDVYNRLATVKAPTTPQKGGNTVGYSNSPLATYKLLSPNHSGQRNHTIDRITPHCFVGQVTAKRGAEVFQPTSKQASCQYVIGKDGDISLVCEEKNRSWCTSSSANDHRAITIEVASDSTHPYTITAAAYEALIKLCADICRRNGKKRITWLANKDKTIDYAPAADEMVFTVHKWFAAKACPGDYIYNHLSDIAARVNTLLGSPAVAPTTTNNSGSTPSPTQTTTKRVTATKAAQEKDTSLSGAYLVTSDDGLNVRNGAGTKINKVLVSLPKNTRVQCYGYYTKDADGAKWLYIQTTYNGVIYTGFCHSAYLKKV